MSTEGTGTMTEQELKKEIAHVIYLLTMQRNGYHSMFITECEEFVEQIIALFKQAGYKSPKEVAEFGLSVNKAAFLQGIAAGKTESRTGYVKLAENQTTPLVPDDYEDFSYVYLASQADMFQAGWRRIILEGRKE